MVYEQLVLLGAPILRSVAGWLHNALEDGKISAYEWKQLLTTGVRMVVPAVALYYGLNVPVEAAAALPLLAEYVFDYFKKAKKA